jgi:hypothetical protein
LRWNLDKEVDHTHAGDFSGMQAAQRECPALLKPVTTKRLSTASYVSLSLF